MRIFKYTFLVFLGLLLLIVAIALAPALWRRWVVYPGLEKTAVAFQQLRKEPPVGSSLNTYRGVMHVHSFWSHDSEGTLFDLVPAAKQNGIDFIFLTDHPHGNLDTFPRGYHGLYEGVWIEPGSEKQGFAVWPLDTMVIDWKTDKDTVAKNLTERGGLVFYSHTEEPHNWANPYYQGMEIYNFHTDTKDESLLPHIINFMVNGKKFRRWAFREMFDEQTTILARWDSLNQQRKIVGYSAVDTHENQNFRARKIPDGRVQWIGPNAKPIDTVKVSFWNRWMFGEPDANGWIFKWMIDTYPEGFNYITNYVLADTLSVASLAEHLKKGHLYIAFKSLADARGFLFYARNRAGEISGILGDSVRVEQVGSLEAVSPFPGQFRLIRSGQTGYISDDSQYSCRWEQPGKGVYRVEVHLLFGGKRVPWLYSNPIFIY